MTVSAASGLPALDGLEQRAVLAGELADRRVSLDQLRQAEEDLDLEILVRADEASVAGPDDQRTVKGEVSLDDGALRRTRTEAMVLRERSPRGVGHRPRVRRASATPGPRARSATRRSRARSCAVERPNEDAAVARLDQQAPAHQSVERGSKRVAADVELLGECDLTEMLAGLEPAVEHLTLERILERLDA